MSSYRAFVSFVLYLYNLTSLRIYSVRNDSRRNLQFKLLACENLQVYPTLASLIWVVFANVTVQQLNCRAVDSDRRLPWRRLFVDCTSSGIHNDLPEHADAYACCLLRTGSAARVPSPTNAAGMTVQTPAAGKVQATFMEKPQTRKGIYSLQQRTGTSSTHS